MDSSSDNSALNEILNYLRNIDDRVSKIEERINIQPSSVESTEPIIQESQVEIKKVTRDWKKGLVNSGCRA